jgi:hypothetical protein
LLGCFDSMSLCHSWVATLCGKQAMLFPQAAIGCDVIAKVVVRQPFRISALCRSRAGDSVFCIDPIAGGDDKNNNRSFQSNGATMVSRCVNPSCETEFRYLHEGRLYHFPLSERKAQGFGSQATATVPFWWLCSQCCASFVAVPDDRFGVRVLAKHDRGHDSQQSSEKRDLSYEQASHLGCGRS